MLWFIGFISVVFYRVFVAGMHSKSLFYVTKTKGYGSKETTYQDLDEDKVAKYILFTALISATWIFSLPIIGIYLLGKRYSRPSN